MHNSTTLSLGDSIVSSSPEVVVIDYGAGNLLSVKRGLESVGAKVTLSSNPEVILLAKKLVLPGVGAFPKAMQALIDQDLVSTIQEFVKSGNPLLAICLGMQLLMDESEEFGLTSGLGLIPGRVVQIPSTSTDGGLQKIPHIGWNELQAADKRKDWSETLLQDIQSGESVYFVHSYMAQPINPLHRVAEANYGGHQISAVISKDRITGCQFHPEKSGEVGLKILRRFVSE